MTAISTPLKTRFHSITLGVTETRNLPRVAGNVSLSFVIRMSELGECAGSLVFRKGDFSFNSLLELSFTATAS
jgi:hypothetical protein